MEPRLRLRRLSEFSGNPDKTSHKKRKRSSLSNSDSDDNVLLRPSLKFRENKQGRRKGNEEDNGPSAPRRRLPARSSRRIQEEKDDGSDDDSDSASESEESESEEEEEHDIIDQILAKKVVTDSSNGSVEQFLVKFKDTAYVHCSWKTREELETCPANIKRLQRYLQNEGSAASDDDDFENDDEPNKLSGSGRYFPPEYCQIDRIFSHRIAKGSSPSLLDLIHEKEWDRCEFLVRWQQQGYDEATWEPYEVIRNLGDEADVRSEIQRYFRFCEPRKVRTSKPANRKRPNNRTSAASLAWKAQSFPTLKFPDGLALRDYQIDGVKWMSFNWSQNRNSILADEMGLGKTVQISAFIHHLATNEGVRGPFLIVAPLSTLQHWRRESESWAGSLNCLVYHGSAVSRDIIRQFEFKYDRKYAEKPFKFDIFVTSYEMVLSDCHIISRISWDVVVVDESHRLKNRDSKLFRELSKFRFKHCVMLTGTPVQNSIEELWVLLHFIDPEVFNSFQGFQDQFGDLKSKEDVDALHNLLRPYFLRRMKADVEKDLPDRQEIVIDVEMTMLQKRLYKAIYEKNTEFLFRKASMPSLMNIGMQLRKCCNHPYLIRGVEEEQVTSSLTDEQKMDLLVAASGKFVLLDKLLPKLKIEGHRVLIFSQMVRMLDIIEDYLNFRDFSYERIDGNIRGGDRQQAIDNFTKNPDIFVFMLATRAGGVGINLTAADTVIIFDSDWNPQNDLQAQARCHRIGQTQNVKVYRLITKNTYEQAMFNRASMKLGLDQAVLHPMTTSTKGSTEKLSKKDIENLLKNGAYSIVEEKSDERSKEFCEKDIDDILASNSRLIQYSSNPTMAGSSFAKASFVITSETGEAPLDIDDPNFWEKVGFHYEPEKSNDLIMFDSRKRRRVQRLNSFSGLDGNRIGKKDVAEDKEDAPYSHNEETEEASTDEDSQSEPGVDKKKVDRRRDSETLHQETVALGDWSLRDRERFVRHLVGFGYDRWTPIRERIHAEEQSAHAHVHTSIMSRPIDHLRLAALNLISACLSTYNNTAAKKYTPSPIRNLLSFPTLSQDLLVILTSQGTEWELPNRNAKATDQRAHMESGFASLKLLPSFKDEKFQLSLKRQAKNYLNSLERAFVLAFSVEQVCGPDMNFLLLAECAHYKLNAASESNWSLADDAALLKGAYQYGQADFDSINKDPESCLHGRIFCTLPSSEGQTKALDGNGDHAQQRSDLQRLPSLKYLINRQRALLTNLGKQVAKITSRVAPAPPSAPARPKQSPLANSTPDAVPVQDALTVIAEQPKVVVPLIDPISAANQALQPILIASSLAPSVDGPSTQTAAEIIGRAVEQVYSSGVHGSPLPLQFVTEYRVLSTTAEEVLRAFPNQLMHVLHKSNYLNVEFETKEKEARMLANVFPTLKGPVEALGDNARDLAVLFRRIRRRSNKILHVQQNLSNWAAANGFGPDPRNIPLDAALPADLAEKRNAEMDLFARITECLDAVTRLNNRNRLILSRLEHLASSRD